MPSENIKLRYGSEKHTQLLRFILARKKPAKDKVQDRIDDFERHDELYDAYLPAVEADRIRKDRFEGGEPDYYTVVVPYSYASLLTAHTYWTSVFLSRTPVFQFTGRHGEPQMKIQALEALTDYQVSVGEMLGPQYFAMHDAPKYGYAVMYEHWDRELTQTSTIEEVPVTFMGVPIQGRTRRVKKTERVVGYEGNKLFNVHPAKFWPDWRVSLADFQKGEFVCREVTLSWNQLLKGRAVGQYFNLDAVERMGKGGQGGYDSDYTGGRSMELPDEEPEFVRDMQSVEVQKGFEIIVELIPKELKLGSSDFPEKWVFTVVRDKVIVEARPLSYRHGKFPVTVLPMDVDAYKLYSTSMLDRLRPMNDVITWLLNQHFYNVRSVLNNNFIYDPSKVVMKDLTRRGHSKLIRLKESAYGTDINKVIQQIPVGDVTKSHMNDAKMVMDMFTSISGINDNLMGQIHPGGRKTATEIRTSSTMGINRLKTIAEYWSAVAYIPMAQRIVQNTQQYYTAEKQFRIAGSLASDAQFITVDPNTIAGFYDFVPVDGTMPIDRYAQANLWREVIMGVSKIPQIAQRYDIAGIFSWMSQLAGLKNIKQFEIQPQMMDPGMAQEQARQGNLVPIREAQADFSQPPEPGQISGMGATG